MALLDWYGQNARILPWRIGPEEISAGEKPDPYHVWLSEIMLQQTTVAAVASRYVEFLERWPTVEAMAGAPVEDVLGQWAGLGYYARARNLHKCAVVIASEQGGNFPDTEEKLLELPGIGEYTAAAIAAIAFDKPAVVIDGNIARIVSRLFAIETQLPAAKPEIKRRTAQIWPAKRSGDFAQGLMDLGAGICKPKSPLCHECPISSVCDAYSLGLVERFPIKALRKVKPQRKGVVFALRNAKGEVLFERRPENGLLGAMLGLPGSPWAEEASDDALVHKPVRADWALVGEVTHTFTHFHLALDVFIANAPQGFRRSVKQQWIAPNQARLPTVMKKAVELAKNNLTLKT